MQSTTNNTMSISDDLVLHLAGGVSVPFDAHVPGITPESLRAALAVAPDGVTVHVRWAHVERRAVLVHLYDALAVAGTAPPQPPRADALLAWDDMHQVGHPSNELQVVGPGERPIALQESFSSLLVESHECINHVRAIVEGLRFPLAVFETLHLNIATELFERFGRTAPGSQNNGAPPVVFVKSYRYKGVVAPLLLWYIIHEQEVLCMLQEFLHVRFGGAVPEAYVWCWQLLPANVNLRTVGANFHNAGILPSLRFLLRYGTPTARVADPVVTVATAERLGNRHPWRMITEYGRNVCALWIGDDVFFYVEQTPRGSDGAPGGITDCRAPDTHTELPPWVLHLLADVAGVQTLYVQRTVDASLAHFQAEHGTPAVRLLRSINWGALPLHWRPLFMRGEEPSATPQQAADAQARLIKSSAAMWEDAEVLAQAIDLLSEVTTIGHMTRS